MPKILRMKGLVKHKAFRILHCDMVLVGRLFDLLLHNFCMGAQAIHQVRFSSGFYQAFDS